jgi:hypothetical protein
MAPTSSSTMLDDHGLDVAMESPPLCWDGVQWYSTSGALVLVPLLPKHTDRKSLVPQCSKEALATGYIP